MISNRKCLKTAAVLAALCAGSAFAQNKPATAFSQDSTRYIENRGQWDPRAKFLSQRPGLDYWVTLDGMMLDTYKFEQSPEGEKRVGHVVKLSFGGATMQATPAGFGALRGTRDYFVGGPANHARGAKLYAEAVMQNVTPGVSVRHYADKGARYDVVVAPGTDPRQVQMEISGAQGLEVGQDGTLYARTSIGNIAIAGLKTYQPVGNARQEVRSQFQVKGNKVSFEIGNYDPRLPLVIDPLVFGSYVGSDLFDPFAQPNEIAIGVSTASSGDTFMVGQTWSPSFPINVGPYGKFNVQGIDAFLIRMDGDAYSASYSAVLGGSQSDEAISVGYVESTGDLWALGATTSADFAGAINAKGAGRRLWVTKFNFGATVTPAFVKYINEPGQITQIREADSGGQPGFATAPNKLFGGKIYDLVTSESGKVYIGGAADSTALAGAGWSNYLPNNVTGNAAFVAELDANADYVYQTMVGADVDCSFGGMAVNTSDELVITGSVDFAGVQDTGLAADPSFVTTAGVFSGIPGVFESGRILQNSSSYVVKLDSSGAGAWALVLGGASSEAGRAVAYDPLGNVYVTGLTNSYNFQRTPGSFDSDYGPGTTYVTKLSSDGGTIAYSTALGSRGNVFPTSIVADSRGVAAVGGIMSFTVQDFDGSELHGDPLLGPLEFACIPGSIVETGNQLNTASYIGGTETVNIWNGPRNQGGFSSTRDGFVTFVNPAGTGLLYSDNIGRRNDETVLDLAVDSVGAVWVSGNTQVAWSRDTGNNTDPNQLGIDPYITANAFKIRSPIGIPATFPLPPFDPMTGAPPAVQTFAASNGFVLKLRVDLPILRSVAFNPGSIAGGLGRFSTATIQLRDPAPTGGVTLTATLSDANSSSFSSTPGDLTKTVTIAGGQTQTTVDVFSLPVTSTTFTDLKVTLDNDFIVARLNIAPWLNSFSVAPASTKGGNQVSARVVLFEQAPVGGVTVSLATDRQDLVTLPVPPQIFVPEGAQIANILLDTNGVDAVENVVVSANLLGVGKNAPLTLNPAILQSFTFNPSRVNGGEDSTGTLTFDGKTGVARSVTISYVAGAVGALVNGNALPTNVVVPAQSKTVSFTVTAPQVPAQSSVTLRGTDGAVGVNGVLLIDDIDIAAVDVTPATDVPSGSILDVTVRLSRAAGPSGFTVDLVSSNPNAGTLEANQVTIPAGQLVSPVVKFNCAAVPVDTTTNITAKKTGFTTRFTAVIVRKISMTLTLDPTTTLGGVENSRGTVTLSIPAPVGGLNITLSSSDITAARIPASSIVIPEGETVGEFTILTRKVPVQKKPLITAAASALVKASKTLIVNPPSIVSLSIDPDQVTGPQSTRGTITFNTGVAAGTVVTLTASPAGVVTIPASITVTSGLSQVSFTIATKAVSTDKNVTITARLGSSAKSANLLVTTPALEGITFNPARLRGGAQSVARVTINQPAPPGGVMVTLSSSNTTFARVSGTASKTIAPGSRQTTFLINTSRVSRTTSVTFTARLSNGQEITGRLTIDP